MLIPMNNPNAEQLCDVSSPDQIITVRPDQATDTVQQLPYFVGISGATAGSPQICKDQEFKLPASPSNPSTIVKVQVPTEF
jgi:uncharacterized RmlC-like cupin family protein